VSVSVVPGMGHAGKRHRGRVALVRNAIALTAALGLMSVSCTQPPPSEPGTTTTTTTPVPPVPPVPPGLRYFGDSATWNRPVSAFGASKALDRYAGIFYDASGGASIARRGHVEVRFRSYAVPIYDAADATTTARVFQSVWSQSAQGFGTLEIGDKVPWNPDWAPGPGTDRAMVVVEPRTGRAWEYWGMGEAPSGCVDFLGPNAQAGFDPANRAHLCAAGAWSYDNLHTASDADGTTTAVRGMGINKLAMVTRADEVAAGVIPHALQLMVTNVLFGGPVCAPARGAAAPGAGSTCGYYLPPATRVEWEDGPPDICADRPANTRAERERSVPMGLRLALRITDAEIDRWLDSRGYEGPLRRTARIFAVALRDYGAIVSESACSGTGIQTDGLINPDAARTWEQAGIVDDGGDTPAGDLLDGLITRDRLYVVNAPR